MTKANNDLKTALGQTFWIGINGTTVDDSETEAIFREFQPGGIVLFQRNVESIEQVENLNASLQKQSGIPLLIAIDQEGGTVERLHQIIGLVPSAMALAATRSRRLIREVHAAHARILRALGFNVNFTPVLDLAATDADNGLGTRCFSDDPAVVIRYAREVIAAHHSAKVLISGKHFPGLGDTDRDSHLDLPIVPRSWSQVVKEDLAPYRKLLSQLDFIMINHAVYADKNKDLPASLASEIVQHFLLDRWRYSGLSISDDLYMGAVSKLYNLPSAIERALLAGNHMALICKPDGVVRAFRRILRRADTDKDLQRSIFRSSSRVLSFKHHHFTEPPKIALDKEIDKLHRFSSVAAERSVTWIGEPQITRLPPAATAFVPQTKWAVYMESGLRQFFADRNSSLTEIIFPLNMNEEEATALARQSQTVWNLVVAVDPHLKPAQFALVRELVQRNNDVYLIFAGFPVVSIPAGVRGAVYTYWSAPQAIVAGAKVLLGEIRGRGVLPLSFPIQQQ